MSNRILLAAMGLLIALAMGILPADVSHAQSSIFLGNVNGDGKISTLDLIQITKHLNGGVQLSCMARLRADVNANRQIDQNDIQLIRQYILWQISSFPGFGYGLGDVDEDGDVDMDDVGRLSVEFQTPPQESTLTPQGKQNADVDGSGGNPTFADAQLLRNCINGSIPKLPTFMN